MTRATCCRLQPPASRPRQTRTRASRAIPTVGPADRGTGYPRVYCMAERGRRWRARPRCRWVWGATDPWRRLLRRRRRRPDRVVRRGHQRPSAYSRRLVLVRAGRTHQRRPNLMRASLVRHPQQQAPGRPQMRSAEAWCGTAGDLPWAASRVPKLWRRQRQGWRAVGHCGASVARKGRSGCEAEVHRWLGSKSAWKMSSGRKKREARPSRAVFRGSYLTEHRRRWRT